MTDEKLLILKNLTGRLRGLLEDPEPGLFTWNEAVGRILDELAQFAPSVKTSGEKK